MGDGVRQTLNPKQNLTWSPPTLHSYIRGQNGARSMAVSNSSVIMPRAEMEMLLYW